MTKNNILFEKVISQKDVRKIGVPQLVYYTPHGYELVEQCGRLCYNSIDKITDGSYEGFINGVVKSGHESVIEHFHVVYLLVKDPKDTDVYRELFEAQNFAHVKFNVTETKKFFVISGNVRMFKDIYREWKNSNSIKNNRIIKGFIDSFFELEPCLFKDFIDNDPVAFDIKKFKTREGTIEDLDSTYADTICNSVVDKDGGREITEYYLTNFSMAYEGIKLHSSILSKHNVITAIEDMPRDTSHQHVRHRDASYSQQSQRYINFSEFVCQPLLGIDMDKKYTIGTRKLSVNDFMGLVRQMYTAIIGDGNKNEVARGVLTNNVMSRIAATRTVHSAKHFLSLRLDSHAQWFIREKIARPMDEFLKNNTSNF